MFKKAFVVTLAFSCSLTSVSALDYQQAYNINDVIATSHEEVKNLPANLSMA